MAAKQNLLIISIALLISFCQCDPDALQDFCIAELKNQPFINGFPCKSPRDVTSDDFFFAGLAQEKDTDNILGSNLTAGNVLSFPGLNTLSMSMNRVDFAPGGINPPHSHPRAAELVFVMRGCLLVGFVATDGKFFSKTLKAGEVFVIPKGLIHFQYNVGKKTATAITSFNSQLPGVVIAANTLFGSTPEIPTGVLTKAFSVDDKLINEIKSKFGN
ncbi:Germin protein [Dioscorea alata]|uniref:Germin protein n=1 Tax=Dioscorea alata TaxID=55571 RepID=A0ACB7UN59_DIOAL|nr:Germin protein [Dioscorea alata]